ncbi:MAG: mechanosensitive ion channel [Flavobacteriaceae bacterium]|jgi:small-conductance mechanosensitive channel|nr:MAG: mechanosensitive ion channel [Flavobacteriaceae bacterium]
MIEKYLSDPTQRSIFYLSVTLLIMIGIYAVIAAILRKFGKNPKYMLPANTIRKVALPLMFILFSLLIRVQSLRKLLGMEEYAGMFRKSSTLLFIFAFTWLVIRALGLVKKLLLARYDIGGADNLKARKVFTQFTILERIVIFLVVVLAIGAALMSFESIREIGVSLFASAGVAGIIIGFSAQKLIATVIAGIQIALTQPIRLDDVVIVEGEWGRIEEISLTYVIVRIWDKRCLVLPTTYFIEKPFQNWTRTTTELLGTVFLYTDYTVPFDALREELQRIVREAKQWNGEVANIQVTDSKADYVEVRATVSADDSVRAWELRVLVREKLISFLQKNYPESIAHTRVLLKPEQKNT